MLLEQIVNGFVIGIHYALVSMGFNLMFGVLRLVNLAYGEILLGAGLAAIFVDSYNAGPFLTALAAVMVSIILGFLIYFSAVRPLGNASDLNSPRHLAVITSTLGASIILQNIAVLWFGANPLSFPRLWSSRQIEILGTIIQSAAIIDIALCALIAILLAYLLKHSQFGLRIRAISDNEYLSRIVGVDANRNKLIAIGVSSGVAGVAALLIFQSIGYISPFAGAYYGFKAIIVVIVAGFINPHRVVAAALALGLAEVFGAAYVSSDYRDVIAFLLLVLVLLLRRRVIIATIGAR